MGEREVGDSENQWWASFHLVSANSLSQCVKWALLLRSGAEPGGGS